MADHLESLERLAGLFDRGVISKEEFDSQKAHLLALAAGRVEEPGERYDFLRRHGRVILFSAAAILAGLGLVRFLATDLTQRLTGKTQSVSQVESPSSSSRNDATDVVSFAPGGDCRPSARFQNLLEQMELAASGEPRASEQLVIFTDPDSPLPLTVSQLNGGIQLSRISPEQPWHGLRLSEVRQSRSANGAGFQLRFRNALGLVKTKLALRGLVDLGVDGLKRNGDTVAGLASVDDAVTLTCAWPTSNDAASNEERL